jgi:hypothetical protein
VALIHNYTHAWLWKSQGFSKVIRGHRCALSGTALASKSSLPLSVIILSSPSGVTALRFASFTASRDYERYCTE